MPSNFSSAVCGFLIGVWFASLFSWGYAVAFFALGLGLIFFVTRFFFPDELSKKVFALASIFFCLFAIGNYRTEIALVTKLPLGLTAGERIEAEGVIIEEPKPGPTANQFILETDKGERLIVRTELYPEYRYGDRLHVAGKLVAPKNFLTDDGREFDYENYLARQNIYYQLFNPQITAVSSGNGFWLTSGLLALRERVLGGIAKVLPEPQSGLLGGLLIGSRESLDPQILGQFKRVGLTHMIVLSGYNLTIVAEAIRHLFGFLSLYAGLGAAGIGIILFALMSGGGAAVWRATLMALLALIARVTGRVYEVTRALAVTVVALLLWNPTYLVFDLGFQLSILATLGLLFLSPLIKVWLNKIPEKFGLREIVASTLAAQLAVLPWILYTMGNLSLVSFLANPLVLIVVPLIMFFGFFTGLFSFVGTWLAFIPGSVAYLFLSYQLRVVSWFSNLPFASVTVSSFPLVLVIAVYGLYILWYAKRGVGFKGLKPRQGERR